MLKDMRNILARILLKLYRTVLPCPIDDKAIFYTADSPAYREYEIGYGTYGFPEVLLWKPGATLKIGKYCSIAMGVKVFLGGNHRMDFVTTYPFRTIKKHIASSKREACKKMHESSNNELKDSQVECEEYSNGNVEIGNDVWIATNVMILSGVKIGDGAVIGAGSIVVKDVPPYHIVAGNPATIVRKRFSDNIIEKLLCIQWWNWPEDRIEAALPSLLSEDVEEFVAENCCYSRI